MRHFSLICLLLPFFISLSIADVSVHSFQSNAKDLLSIFSRSIYKKSSDFVRELLSNSVDALNLKKRSSLMLGGGSLEDYTITVVCDPLNNQLIFIDTGIGMDDVEMQEHLGTFAKSGTKEKLQQMKGLNSTDSSELIGQFGLGFYSSFIVADTVTVVSRKYSPSDESFKKYAWFCDINVGTYSIKEIADNDPLEQTFPVFTGTKIILQLSDSRAIKESVDEADEERVNYFDPELLKAIISEYSQYISYPIYLVYDKIVTSEVPIQEDENPIDTKDENVEVEEDSEQALNTQTITSKETVFEHVNTQKPIWIEPSSNVSDEQYVDFYKNTFKDSSDPILHYRGSGGSLRVSDFKYLIYVPRSSSFDPFSNEAPPKFLKLYVKKIFVTDDFGDMFPRYLSFVKGIVDVEDLPLNISRESLQDVSILKSIFKHLTSKIISLIQDLSKNITSYEPFYKAYGRNIKLGLITEKDQKRKDSLMSLLFVRSSNNVNGTFLDQYIERMAESQTDIYFVTGESIKEMRKLPQIEKALKRGYEILYLDENVDEYLVQANPSYNGKKLRNLAKSGIQLTDDEEKKQLEEAQKTFKPLATYMKKMFSSSVGKVIVSQNLERSPIAINPGEMGMSPQMEKVMKSHKNDVMAHFYLNQKKVIEINPNHPLIISMLDDIVGNSEPDKEFDSNLKLLYYSAILHSGYEIPNPADFAQTIEDLLRSKYGLDSSSQREVTEEDILHETENPKMNLPNFADEDGEGMMPDMESFMNGDYEHPLGDPISTEETPIHEDL